jgi:hypothetical protein
MIDRRLAVLLVGTAGCMRIYPDPELPDVIVAWPSTCGDDGVTVRVEVVSLDGTEISQDGACADGELRVEDLERTSYTITASLLDGGGGVLGRTMPSEVDLRGGYSRRSDLTEFARDHSFFRVAWTFDGGDSCASLDASRVLIDFQNDEVAIWDGGPCADGALDYLVPIESGTYAVQLFAQRPGDYAMVAASELRPEVVIPDRGEIVDLGTIALTRCTPICETPLPPEPPGGD